MKSIKGLLTIIGLLSLGFVGGFFTHRQVTIQQVQKVREIGQAPGFQRHLLQFLEPSADQREQLEPIISRYAQQMGEQWREHRAERKVLVDAMHEEIKPLLTSDQLQKLDDFSKRFRTRRDKNGKSRREKRPEQTGLEQ
ncbi:hypothetical protein [Flavilitoribacter nigricans]|uniref:Periplasmic heavy metal sensor n=1 Tax=Flavilitoribacter nigricans (strain ATCC 23147 / DSM 23189 / NBRC 102662 / NCIMB 1420 / SS-2) TaxID=1122177 RepID=A0A2D0N5S3_FLAN2|nr:hypothetical protein [Flavilitoribacter nigricans]PHN03123.1 hypothetical protein CRP01_29015 [Flavilitoribacter nigricans DSM 23189 = NBRC 102662]